MLCILSRATRARNTWDSGYAGFPLPAFSVRRFGFFKSSYVLACARTLFQIIPQSISIDIRVR